MQVERSDSDGRKLVGRLRDVLAAKAAGTFTYDDLVVDNDVAKISVVGIEMRSHAGIAATIFQALSTENVNIKVIARSEIKISVLIDRKYMEPAVQRCTKPLGWKHCEKGGEFPPYKSCTQGYLDLRLFFISLNFFRITS
jgi:aspartokinase